MSTVFHKNPREAVARFDRWRATVASGSKVHPGFEFWRAASRHLMLDYPDLAEEVFEIPELAERSRFAAAKVGEWGWFDDIDDEPLAPPPA